MNSPVVLMDTSEILVERLEHAKGRFSLMEGMRVERGSKEDWNQLHELHYKAESLPAGPVFWRCVTAEGSLVGIVVMSSPTLLLAPRHQLFPNLKPGGDTKYTNKQRAVWLNQNFRRAARIVTDTLYRGVGVSYRMVNLAMRMQGIRFIEIQSSMSKYNPFDVKAGFRHANLKNAAAYDKGLDFFRTYFTAHPGDHVALMEEFAALPPTVQKTVDRRIREFYYKHSAKEKTGGNLNVGTSAVMARPLSQIIKELQQLVLATPAYGIWENPDLGRVLPQSLPLSAFDLQKPTEPLRLDLL